VYVAVRDIRFAYILIKYREKKYGGEEREREREREAGEITINPQRHISFKVLCRRAQETVV